MVKIDRFAGAYEFLSNFYIEKNGKSLEHGFQAAKFVDHPEIGRKVFGQPSPGKAKGVARQYSDLVDPDWYHGESVQVMLKLLREKFTYGSDLANKLMATGSAWLEEGNRWGDEFYGTVNGKGANVLGLLLMLVRLELLARSIKENAMEEGRLVVPLFPQVAEDVIVEYADACR